MEIVQRFEARVFHYGIILGIIFRAIRLVHEVMIDSPLAVLLLGGFNLLLFDCCFLFTSEAFSNRVCHIFFSDTNHLYTHLE